jgi:hypothetical protein
MKLQLIFAPYQGAFLIPQLPLRFCILLSQSRTQSRDLLQRSTADGARDGQVHHLGQADDRGGAETASGRRSST